MKLSIFTTTTNPKGRGDNFDQAMECYKALADEVVVVYGEPSILAHKYVQPTDKIKTVGEFGGSWSKEFNWKLIGQHFQKGYEACTGDWVIRMDLDMVFHENDYGEIRRSIESNQTAPGLSFYKKQFIQPDRFNVKSRLIVALNKGMYGDKIRFDGGRDLCQATLNGELLKPGDVPETKVAIWNYECLTKTKEQIISDKGRFARAWQRTYGEYKLGGPDDASAYNKWLEMVVGRNRKIQELIPLSFHPKVMQETIKKLKPENFGYNMFGNSEVNTYA